MSAPANRPPACVHVDLDGGPDVFAAHGWAWPLSGDPLFASGMARALELFEVEGIRATFFAVARDLDDRQKRPLLEEAVRRGHAIGSHSVTHRPTARLGSGDKRSEVFDSKARLEAELGVAVEGFRAPGFHIDRETLELVAEAGYRYDSSLFPSAADAAKVRLERVPPAPHAPLAGQALLELPLPAHPGPVPFHPSYSLVLGQWWFRRGLARTTPGAPLVLLCHLTDFAEPLPAEALPGLRARLFTISHRSARAKADALRRMLERVRRGYELGDTAALLTAAGAA